MKSSEAVVQGNMCIEYVHISIILYIPTEKTVNPVSIKGSQISHLCLMNDVFIHRDIHYKRLHILDMLRPLAKEIRELIKRCGHQSHGRFKRRFTRCSRMRSCGEEDLSPVV